MADLQHRDIRRCIMSAQLWLSSTTDTQAHETKVELDPHTEEEALPPLVLKGGCPANSSMSWLLTKQLGVEVYSWTGSSACRGLLLSVGAAHLSAQKHCAMQQQGIDIIYPLYEEQLRRMSESKEESRTASSSALPKEQTDGSQAAAAVKEQLKLLLWCSGQMSSLDIISGPCSKHCSHPSNVKPWWSVSEQDSLLDDHRDAAVDSQVGTNACGTPRCSIVPVYSMVHSLQLKPR